MPNFYENLDRLEQCLDTCMTILPIIELDPFGESAPAWRGTIEINNTKINTNRQLEMLSLTFFAGEEEYPIIYAYKNLFERAGILPLRPAIPLFRDVPFRSYRMGPNVDKQYELFARFLEEDILPNNWQTCFPLENDELRAAIRDCYVKNEKPLEERLVRHAPDGTLLTSGGYWQFKQLINKLPLWLHKLEGNTDRDIDLAVSRTLGDTENTNLIVNHLKACLAQKNNIAFNVRGVDRDKASREDIQGTDLGGGHQFYLLVDRACKTIYTINDTMATDDTSTPRAFKDQIQLFLRSIGDQTEYAFQYIGGRSRQPENATYLTNPCGISQFFHYAASLSGIAPHDIKKEIPAKLSTLMYALLYAVRRDDKPLLNTLAQLLPKIEEGLKVKPSMRMPDSNFFF